MKFNMGFCIQAMEYFFRIANGIFHPKRLRTLRTYNTESIAARDVEPKQMEYSIHFLLIEIFYEAFYHY